MKSRKFDTKKMVLLAMLAAIAYLAVVLIRIPVMLFLSYEPKDVIIVISGFLFGPIPAGVVSLVVSLVEMFSISDTGPIGALMNFLSTCSFACTAAFIYHKNRTGKGAVAGLICGSLAMIGVMLLWNYMITPLYMTGTTRQDIAAMLLPVFLPFNALKAGLNTAITLLIYKPLTSALRRARLLPETSRKTASAKPGIYLLGSLLLVSCILLLLVLRGIL